MKKIFLVLFTFVSLTTQPAHCGPIIIIWPSYVDKATIHPQEILGSWTAKDEKNSWIVQLERDQVTGLIQVSLQPTTSETYQATGHLHPNGNTLYGRIAMDGRMRSLLLFRDHDGTKLRIIINKTNYYDLVLSSFILN